MLNRLGNLLQIDIRQRTERIAFKVSPRLDKRLHELLKTEINHLSG